MAFSRVDSVGRHEDEPMRRSALAVAAIGELPHSSGEPFWRAGGAEHRGQELVLDGALTWPLLRLSLGKVQWAPVAEGSNRSFGTDGRSLGSRSTPQPGIRARSWSEVSLRGGFCDV